MRPLVARTYICAFNFEQFLCHLQIDFKKGGGGWIDFSHKSDFLLKYLGFFSQAILSSPTFHAKTPFLWPTVEDAEIQIYIIPKPIIERERERERGREGERERETVCNKYT